MATRAIIAKLDDKGVQAIYCHNDGYLSNNGKILDQHYQNEEKVDELLAQGDVSIINENIGVKLDFDDYKLFYEKEQCKFYHRDRGEDLMFNEFESEEEYVEWANGVANGFIYLYAYGAWYVYDNGIVRTYGRASHKFVELEEALHEIA